MHSAQKISQSGPLMDELSGLSHRLKTKGIDSLTMDDCERFDELERMYAVSTLIGSNMDDLGFVSNWRKANEADAIDSGKNFGGQAIDYCRYIIRKIQEIK